MASTTNSNIDISNLNKIELLRRLTEHASRVSCPLLAIMPAPVFNEEEGKKAIENGWIDYYSGS